MGLWERDEALEVLEALLRKGSGELALVAGEAGIGKSVLVNEFSRRCRVGADVLLGRCDRLVTPRALGPLHDIGRQTRGALAECLASGASQGEIFEAFIEFVSSPFPRTRTVVVVEDVHWADEATLDWIQFLGRRLDRLRVLLILTYRDDEIGARHPLRGTLATLPAAVLHDIPLHPLSRECVVNQARLGGRDPDLVYQLAGGNPLLVTELLKADGWVMPRAAQDLILDRIRALPSAARDLAQLVSVAPTQVETNIIADALDLVDLCVDAGVLVARDTGVSFRHELLRSAVENSLSPARRVSMHKRVLAALEEQPDVDPGRLVHHAVLAGDADAILRLGQLAGASAARQGAHREAAAHYRAAAQFVDRLPTTQQARLWEEYAIQANLAGLFEDGLAAREAALEVCVKLGEPERVGENLRWVSRLAWWTGRAEYSRRAAAEAMKVLEAVGDHQQLAMAYSNQSQLCLLYHDVDGAISWGERARELAKRSGDRQAGVHAEINVHTAKLALDDRRAQAALEEIHRRAAGHGFVEHAARALANLAAVMADELAEHRAAVPLLDRALTYALENDLGGIAQFLHGARAQNRFAMGDWKGALADADEVLADPTVSGFNTVVPLTTRGQIAAAYGWPDAIELLDSAAAKAQDSGEAQLVIPVAAARSEYFLWAGDSERAQIEARKGLEKVLPFRQPYMVGQMSYRLWRAGATDEIPAAIAEPYFLMMNGDWAAAAAEWERRGNVYAKAEALAFGDHEAIAESLRILDGLGAIRASEFLRGQLRKQGVAGIPRGPRQVTAAHPAGLTPRQVDVLALLTDGLSNTQIAVCLHLSPKTIDHHISAILTKLNVANRGQAAATARRLRLVP